MEYVRAGCASLIALVFVVSAVSKLRDFGGFAESLPAFTPIRADLVRPAATVVVVLEGAVALLLTVSPARSYGFGLGCVLLAAFTVAIAAGLKGHRRVSCRCFGASSKPAGVRHLVRNGVLLAACVLGGVEHGAPPPLAGAAVAVAAGLAGAMLIISFDDVVDLFARNL